METLPGAMALTVTPWAANSWASDLVRPITPHLEAAYAEIMGLAERPIIDETVTTRPHRPATRWRAAAATVLKTPVRLTPMVSSHTSVPRSKTDPRVEIPALATTMPTPPSSAAAPSTKAPRPSRSRTSTTPVTHRRPSASTRRAVSARSAAVASG